MLACCKARLDRAFDGCLLRFGDVLVIKGNTNVGQIARTALFQMVIETQGATAKEVEAMLPAILDLSFRDEL